MSLAGKRFAPVVCSGPAATVSGLAKHSSKEVVMALSDQLTGLATRAKEAEDRAAAAQGKAKVDLEADVET